MEYARLIFENPTEEQLEHIRRAAAELALAGVTFDSGANYDDDRKILSCDWELDWSLRGARIQVYESVTG